jgi:hypothetical protein
MSRTVIWGFCQSHRVIAITALTLSFFFTLSNITQQSTRLSLSDHNYCRSCQPGSTRPRIAATITLQTLPPLPVAANALRLRCWSPPLPITTAARFRRCQLL